MEKQEKNDTLAKLERAEPCLWLNPACRQIPYAEIKNKPDIFSIRDAAKRLRRFSPVLQTLFPELIPCGGIIDSGFVPIPAFGQILHYKFRTPQLSLFLKADHSLPVSGSVKARGGFYAVMCIAERIALDNQLLTGIADDYTRLPSPKAKEIFGKYKLSVGSTGNLGLSIGIMGNAFGFKVTVHMSSDAKAWKKAKLREIGVTVLEHTTDYIAACAVARREAEKTPFTCFIDDENSEDLFLGYSVAALHLKKQLEDAMIPVDEEHPLFVYLPCGVGGAPGGITLGLKELFGDNVYCFFAEPVQTPCMILGMVTGKHSDISVRDIGLSGITDADGLAVAKPSRFVGQVMEPILDGCYTVTDRMLYRFLYLLKEDENIRVEPSAAAGCYGPIALNQFADAHLRIVLPKATHIIWTTGGNMVPRSEYHRFLEIGAKADADKEGL